MMNEEKNEEEEEEDDAEMNDLVDDVELQHHEPCEFACLNR